MQFLYYFCCNQPWCILEAQPHILALRRKAGRTAKAGKLFGLRKRVYGVWRLMRTFSAPPPVPWFWPPFWLSLALLLQVLLSTPLAPRLADPPWQLNHFSLCSKHFFRTAKSKEKRNVFSLEDITHATRTQQKISGTVEKNNKEGRRIWGRGGGRGWGRGCGGGGGGQAWNCSESNFAIKI